MWGWSAYFLPAWQETSVPSAPYLLSPSKYMVSRRRFIFSPLNTFSIRHVTHE